MTQLDIHEAGSRLSDLISRAKAGEEIVIADDGIPAVRLVPVEIDANPRLKVLGMFKGQIWMSKDFNDPLTNEEMKDWGI